MAPVGVDLSIAHARLARSNGVASVRASVLALPFPAHRFDSGWTMSTLVHVPDRDFDQAMSELVGEIEQFDTWPDDRSTWEYQFVVLRVGTR